MGKEGIATSSYRDWVCLCFHSNTILPRGTSGRRRHPVKKAPPRVNNRDALLDVVVDAPRMADHANASVSRRQRRSP